MALAEEDRRALGERLRELRGGRPQRVVAAKVPITERQYRAWENGEAEPHWDNVVRLAAALDTDAEWIYYGDRGNTPDPFANPQLDRIEAKLDALLNGRPAAGAPQPPGELGRRATGTAPKPAPRQRAPKRRGAGGRPSSG